MPVRQRRPFAHLQHQSEATRALRLTARQQQILDWIRAFIAANGMPPTRAEIAAGLGFSTASSAEDHLQALAKKGVLDLLPGAARKSPQGSDSRRQARRKIISRRWPRRAP